MADQRQSHDRHLKSIGIEKGRPFTPDDADPGHTRRRHAGSARLARHRYENVFHATFYDDARGHARLARTRRSDDAGFSKPDSYPVDNRGVAYSWAFFSAKQLGAGQFYLMTINDKNGDPFDGAATYRLSVPAGRPGDAVLVGDRLDRATHTLIRDMPWASRSSNTPGLQSNATDR